MTDKVNIVIKRLFYAVYLTIVIMSSIVSFHNYIYKIKVFKKLNSDILLYVIFFFLFLISFLFFKKEILKKLSKLASLIFLPLWGLVLNFSLDTCGCSMINKMFKSPDVLSIYFLYGLSLSSYYISRKRRERLRPFAEMFLTGSLVTGIILCAIIIIQYIPVLIFIPLIALFGMPLVAPFIIIVFFIAELGKRLSLRGEEEIDTNWFLKSKLIRLLSFLPIIGIWSIIHRLIFSVSPHTVFTKTCGWIFSKMPPPDCGGHYLCTVALKGHKSIVKPERLGKRNGKTIVVNRQLAIANAFEDLLIERFPKTARCLRKIYDTLGPPVAKYIKYPLLADIIYLIVKPLEYLFYVILLLFDNNNPEKRIDAMYTK